MNTLFLEMVAAIKQTVLVSWEAKYAEPDDPDAPGYLFMAIELVNDQLHELLLHQYESYGSKLTFMQALMQLDHLHELDLIELLPSRDELEHFCLHDLLHLMLEELIMTELVDIGQERGYFILGDQGDVFDQASPSGPQQH